MEPDPSSDITRTSIMRSILWIHIAIIIGYSAYEALEAAGVKLPLFVPCLISGILLANGLPLLFPKRVMHARSSSTDLISEFNLSVFLAMSPMSMEPWTLASRARILAETIVLQSVAATTFIVFWCSV